MSEVIGVGADLVDIHRIRALIKRFPNVIERIFSDQEQEFAKRQSDPTQRFAVRFAAKEAVMKALGIGFGAVRWKDIEVQRSEFGAPNLQLSGRAKELSIQRGISQWKISLSHTETSAIAIVIAQ